ncbi:MAG: hypothetical protein KKA19_07700 [Candidatus Margulisbacteria bacterium]|nr:hypothetical protein [Candidatus Margulisiibacteriota bacterium]
MKKLIFFIACFVLIAQGAWAVFTMSVTGGSPVNIGSTYLGESNFTAGPITLTCQSDQTNPWEIQIYATGDLVDNSTGLAIPIQNLKWYGAYEDSGSGSFIKGTGGQSIPLTIISDTLYSDTGASTNAITVQVGLGVTVPEVQPMGNYATTVRFIMTE